MVRGVRLAESGRGDRPIDRVEIVNERAETLELLLPEAIPHVPHADRDAIEPPDQAPVDRGRVRIDIAGRAQRVGEQLIDARIAAQHSVQSDHIVTRERIDRAVAHREGGAVGEPSLIGEGSSVADRSRAEVDAVGARGAASERRERQVTCSASDVQHRSVFEALPLQGGEEMSRDRRGRPLLARSFGVVGRPFVEAARGRLFVGFHDDSVRRRSRARNRYRHPA